MGQVSKQIGVTEQTYLGSLTKEPFEWLVAYDFPFREVIPS